MVLPWATRKVFQLASGSYGERRQVPLAAASTEFLPFVVQR
jgi:hypothetical protein